MSEFKLCGTECRLDSRLALFVIISSYNTLSWCQRVVRIQITFKTIQTPATEEFEQGKLKVKIELHFTAQQIELITGMKEFRMFW